MKTLFAACSIAALAVSSLTPNRADACGSYQPEPAVFRLSTHFVVGMGKANHRRTFALLPHAQAPARGLSWSQLAPMSYDATEIATAKPFASPLTLTLVGSKGTRVVSSSKHVFLSRSWTFTAATGAVEVSAGDGFSIALEGSQPHAKWIETEQVASTSATLRWVRAQGIEPFSADSIYVSRVPGTQYEAVAFYPKTGDKMITLLRRGEQQYGRFTGSPIGAFENGTKKLVLVDGASVTPIEL